MGRKLAVGCLTVFAVLFVAGGVFLYLDVLRPARDVVVAAQSVGQIQQLEEGVRKRGGFEAPEDGLLDRALVERYLAVQRNMETALSGRLAELETKYEQFEAEDTEPDLGQLAGAWADVMNLLVEAKEAQVDALNELNFSLEEYDWTRAAVLQAAGHAIYGYDLSTVLSGSEDVGRLEQAASVPRQNVDLLEPYREDLEEYLPLAYFGL